MSAKGRWEGALPGAVTNRLQKMQREMDKAERVLSGVASQDFKVGQALWDEIQKGYGGQFSPEHPEVKAALERMAAVQAKIDQGQTALALAQDGDGYYYKVVSFQQPRLITGDWGKLTIIKDRQQEPHTQGQH